MADESLAPMTDWRERVWARYDLVVPAGWSEAYADLVAAPFISETPCFKVPCPPFSPEHETVDLPSIIDSLQFFAADYRYHMRVLEHDSVVTYVPEWIYQKFTAEQIEQLENSGITVRTHW